MTRTSRSIGAWLAMLVLSGCGLMGSGAQEVITLEVAPTTVECVGEGTQRCLQVREAAHEEWRLFYDHIEGFTFEEGFRYSLRVSRTRISDPVADGSAFRYRLVDVLSREAAAG
jgi:hypothetical protein